MTILNKRFFVFSTEGIDLLDYLFLVSSTPLLVVLLGVSLAPYRLVIFVPSHCTDSASVARQESIIIWVNDLPLILFVVLSDVPRIGHALIYYVFISDYTLLY